MKRCKVDVNYPRITARQTFHKYMDYDTGKVIRDKCTKITPSQMWDFNTHHVGFLSPYSTRYYESYHEAPTTDYQRWKAANPDDY